jgi:magnesium-protoporphyrin O-methyltransferase
LLGWLPQVCAAAPCSMPAAAPAASAWKPPGGAAVSAIDVAGGLVDIAQQRAPAFLGHGRIDWHVGDMLDPRHP